LNQFPIVTITCHNSPLLGRFKSLNSNLIKNETLEIEQALTLNNQLNSKPNNQTQVYIDKDTISGEITLNLIDVNLESFEHNGLSIELMGTMTTADGYNTEFLHLLKDIESAGVLIKNSSYGFCFKEVNLPYESFKGELSEIKYILKASIAKNFLNIKSKEEVGIRVIAFPTIPKLIPQINMDICHSNFISMEFRILESKISTKGVICGSVKIKEVNIQVESIEIDFIKRETLIGSRFSDTLITRHQICDGTVEESDCLPIRIYLSSYNLNPTYPLLNNLFSVKYFVNLKVIDSQDKTYSFLEEIVLFR